jgi:hypothetical protein
MSPKHACPFPLSAAAAAKFRTLWLQGMKAELSKHPGHALTSHMSVQPSEQCGTLLCCLGNGFRKESNALSSNAFLKLVHFYQFGYCWKFHWNSKREWFISYLRPSSISFFLSLFYLYLAPFFLHYISRSFVPHKTHFEYTAATHECENDYGVTTK